MKSNKYFFFLHHYYPSTYYQQHKLRTAKVHCSDRAAQGRSQPHMQSRVGKSSTVLIFPQISIDFLYFSSNFTYFLPHFSPLALGGWVAHPGRAWPGGATCSLNSRDLFLNLRRLVKMTKPLRFENKSLRLKYKCLICIWIIFWAILDLFINPKYLFQNKSFSRTYYFKSEKKFCHFNKSIRLKNKSREFRQCIWSWILSS